MNFNELMRGFTIRFRMRAAIVVVLALFALVGATGAAGLLHLKDLNDSFMVHAIGEARNFGDIRSAIGQLRRHEKDMVIRFQSTEDVAKSRKLWDASLADLRKGLEGLLVGEEDDDNPLARAALQSVASYAQVAQRVFDAPATAKLDSSRAVDAALADAKPHTYKVQELVDQIGVVLAREVDTARADSAKSTRQAMWAYAGVMLLMVVIVVPLTLLNSNSIVTPLGHAREVATAIARGDLTQPIDARGKDEAAELLGALQAMQDSLRGIVAQVRQSAESIQVASSEVASGNTDLSGRTEQAASNLQQTASSMEQLTGTVKQSAESAHTANQLANSAAEVAQRGGTVVSQVVSTMEEIHTASKRIADIIGVIDGIAFQTNILALNAAVEAARAGEQGRGFAVVAGEVRSLAGRSAEAAREIKSLIGASVEKVDSGSRLVRDAGSTMNEIVSSVQRVSDMIAEITAAASEQSTGIGQINGSVVQLDQMTQQNAALVEQSAAAAESLKDQAQRLAEAVAVFRLGAGHAGPTPSYGAVPSAKAPAPAVAAPKPAAPKPAASPAPAPSAVAAADADWQTF